MKPKMIEVTGDLYQRALAAREDLGTPTFVIHESRMYMQADEYRAWVQASQSDKIR